MNDRIVSGKSVRTVMRSGVGRTGVRWYVITCFSPLQSQIVNLIKKKAEEENFASLIEEIKEIKKMVRSSKTKKIENRSVYPGYIFIRMMWNSYIYNLIRSINGVKGFLGTAGSPTPLSSHEVEQFIERMEQTDSSTEPSAAQIDFKEGDYVKITVSNLQGRECEIIKMNHTTRTATVKLEMFGRMVATDVNFNDCEKVF